MESDYRIVQALYELRNGLKRIEDLLVSAIKVAAEKSPPVIHVTTHVEKSRAERESEGAAGW